MQRVFSIGLVVLLAACGGDDGDGNNGNDGGNNGSDGAPGADAFVPPVGSLSVTWGPIDVPPLTEDTKCVTKELTNPAQIRVGTFQNTLGAVSHHYILYRVANSEPLNDVPTDCQPFAGALQGSSTPIMITQVQNETLVLPEGVAYTFEPNQRIRLEMHYLNATDAPQTLSATSVFTPMPDVDFQFEADFLFMGDSRISIPAMSQMTVGPSYFATPNQLRGQAVNFFAVTGHTHQWGTNVSVAVTDGPTGTDTPVYDVTPFLWDEPATVTHDPPFQLDDNGGFRFSCEYLNQSNSTVTFGEATDKEMCFFWAYYYPSQGSLTCVIADVVPNGLCL